MTTDNDARIDAYLKVYSLLFYHLMLILIISIIIIFLFGGCLVKIFLLLFVGNKNSGFAEYYVILDNIKYKVNTALEAVDFLFKLFFSVDMSYPVYSYHIEQFIQIVGFVIGSRY